LGAIFQVDGGITALQRVVRYSVYFLVRQLFDIDEMLRTYSSVVSLWGILLVEKWRWSGTSTGCDLRTVFIHADAMNSRTRPRGKTNIRAVRIYIEGLPFVIMVPFSTVTSDV
jgi:hypothetical protein